MRNLNESRKNEAEVVPFEPQRGAPVPAQQSPLLQKSDTEESQNRWTTIQAGFVDEPRKTVEEADKFVADAIQRTSQIYSDERKKLEGLWNRGDQVSTEDLRVALQRYRALFSRLMTM